MDIKRRRFLQISATAALGAVALSPAAEEQAADKMPKRTLGRTGEQVSLLTLGGYHIGVPSLSEEESVALIRTAIDAGVNFLDNAWMYHNGRSETVMGKALKDGYRDKVLLMTKTEKRTVEGAAREFEESLRRFDLDRVDLLQFHGIAKQSDIDAIYNDGLLDWAEKKRDEGLIRYIGFTGHSDPKLHAEMITRGYAWDTVQMPVNVLDQNNEASFGKMVIPLAVERNIGIIAMKTNAGGRVARSGAAKAIESLRFAMSQPISTAVSGMDSMAVLQENLAMVKSFKPYTEEEQKVLLSHGRPAALTGQHEAYRMAGYRDGQPFAFTRLA